MDHNIATVLETVADAIPETIAITQGQSSRTWAALDVRASRLAGFLGQRGVVEGSVVAIGLPNRIEHVESILAIAKLRAVAANLNYRYRSAEIEHVLNDCAAVALVAEPDVVERTVDASDLINALATMLSVAGPDSASDMVAFEEAIATSAPTSRVERSGHDRFIIYTGGTTGTPKATSWRQSRLGATWDGAFAADGMAIPTSLAELAAIVVEAAGRSPRTVVLPACPMIHATGLHTTMGTLTSGGCVAFAPAGSFDPAAISQTVEQQRVTAMTIVGDAFARPLLEELRSAESRGRAYDISSLQRVASSGVVWSADVKAGLLEFVDARLIDVLASSEGGPYAISETRRGAVMPTSRFVLAPAARIIDEDGNDIEPGSGRVGFLASSNFSSPDGYLGDDTKSAATFRLIDGVRWSVPGDRATIEADGRVVLLGRDSSVINTGGEKVFAEEVENVLAEHPLVSDVLVAPSPDPRWGSVVTAIVQATACTPVDDAELSAFVTERLAGYKQPRRYIFVPEIRRSPAGKADRAWAVETARGS